MARTNVTSTSTPDVETQAVQDWNANYEPGIPVLCWHGVARQGEPQRSRTGGPARLKHGTAIVHVVNVGDMPLEVVERVPADELVAELCDALRWTLQHVQMSKGDAPGWTPKAMALWHREVTEAAELLAECEALR